MYVKSYAICLRRNQGCLSKGCSSLRSYFLLKVALFFLGGGKNAGIPMDSIYGNVAKKNTRGLTTINHFQRILGRSLLSVTYPYDVIHLRFPWIDKHQGTSNHVFKCNFSICDARLWLQYPVGKWIFSSNCGTILREYNELSESPIEQHNFPHLPANIAN